MCVMGNILVIKWPKEHENSFITSGPVHDTRTQSKCLESRGVHWTPQQMYSISNLKEYVVYHDL